MVEFKLIMQFDASSLKGLQEDWFSKFKGIKRVCRWLKPAWLCGFVHIDFKLSFLLTRPVVKTSLSSKPNRL
jgi:hypothetical protein